MPQFQKESGQTLAITWGTAAMLTKRIEAGEPADVAILTRPNIDTLSKEGKIAAGTEVTLAQSGIVIGIKSGARKPDISGAEALKETLLNQNPSLTAIRRPEAPAAFTSQPCSTSLASPRR